MSPAIVQAGAGAASKDVKKESATARLLGSGCAGIAELLVFHPVDTTAKRLMSNQTRITSATTFNQVVFKEYANATVGRKFTSLFPGLGYAAGYKVGHSWKHGHPFRQCAAS
jgi:hypothetical protein